MSKPVRLPDYLYAEVERLAKEERRSLANMVQVLLEQSLKLDGEPMTKVQPHVFGGDIQVTTTARTERRREPDAPPPPAYFPEREVKPDFKGKK